MAFPTPTEIDIQPYSGAGFPTSSLAAVTAGDVLIAVVARRGSFVDATALTPSLIGVGTDRPFTAFGAQVNTPDSTISALIMGYRIATGDEEGMDWDQYSQQHITLFQLPSTADPTTATVVRRDEQSANTVFDMGTFDAAGHFVVQAYIYNRDFEDTDYYSMGSGWTVDHSDSSDSGRPYVEIGHATPSGSIAVTASSSVSVEWAGFAVHISATAAPLPDCDSPMVLDVYSLGTATTPALTYLATLCDAFDKSIRVELDGTGSGKFSINRSSLDATVAILGNGDGGVRYVKVRIPDIDADPIFGFFIEKGDFRLLDSDEDGGETLTFEGHGSLAYLDFAVMAAHSYLTTPFVGEDPFGGLWRLYAAGTGSKPGQILARVIAELQEAARPSKPVPLLTDTFDYTNDSSAAVWASTDATDEFSAAIGESVLSVAGRLIGSGEIVVQMSPDFVLGGYNTFGTDRTSATFAANKVRFVGGTNIAEGLTRQIRPSRVATHVVVYGEEEHSVVADLGDAATRVTREAYLSSTGSTFATLEAVGLAELTDRQRRSESLNLRIRLGDDEATGLYLPGPSGTNGHFWVGDLVTLQTGTGEYDYNNTAFQVAAINIIEGRDVALVTDLEVNVELGSVRIGPAGGGTTIISSTGGGGSGGSVPPHTHPSGVTDAELRRHGGQSKRKGHGNMGATETFDPVDGNVHIGTLNANCTFTLTAPLGNGDGVATLELYITASGTRTWTWPGSVVWPGGVTPDPPADTLLKRIILETTDDGTTWYGVEVGGGTTSFATPAIVLGTAAAAGAATTAIRSDSTIVAFDATVPTTIAAADAAAAGSAAVAARRDHRHGAPASFGIGELLISDTPSTPLIFADLIQNEAETDLLYADP